ncbi:hypothetical protein L6452_01529 [Arctium lappa]|uniref:Uncharacterized protein n=1 Tax=Arctium lappa TaxID=4217 RepID=A0ACB9FHJ2_ARCLA|nr:hypothetical protein L6452_01529 [Arctium lappa]
MQINVTIHILNERNIERIVEENWIPLFRLLGTCNHSHSIIFRILEACCILNSSALIESPVWLDIKICCRKLHIHKL